VNTVRDLLGLDADASTFLHDTHSGTFATNALPPQEVDVDRYREAAEGLATRATADLAKLLKCDTKVTGEDACATRFIADFGARAFRRPLVPEETALFNKVYAAGKAESFATGVRLVVEATLQAPSFLYQAELGGAPSPTPLPRGTSKLTGHEVASRLSYLLWNSTPDGELFTAAAMGQLDDVAGVRKQAERLIASDRFLDTAASFHAQLFHADKLERDGEVSKGTGFPEFDLAMRKAMTDEVKAFARWTFSKGDGSVASLLSAPYVFPTGPLTKLYGAAAPAPGPDGRSEVKNGSRAGLLTLPASLTAEPALATPYGAVYRGKTVRTNLLCQDVPVPQVQVEFKPPPNADKLNSQQLLRAHQENPTCAPCHTLMDAIGFGLENYDAIGKWRTTGKDGLPIDATGELVGVPDGKFDGPKALAIKLAANPGTRACLARQWLRFAVGRDGAGGDACAVKAAEDVLAKGTGDVRAAILALVGSDAFRFRRSN
jgi:hypothetical protein